MLKFKLLYGVVIQYIIYSGLMITGGDPESAGLSAEIFAPSSGLHCSLPEIPGGARYKDIIENWTIYGGGKHTNTRTSGLSLKDGTWQTATATLLDRR